MEPAGFSLREPERTSPTEVSSGVRVQDGAAPETHLPLPAEGGSLLRPAIVARLGFALFACAPILPSTVETPAPARLRAGTFDSRIGAFLESVGT
jgi:hypothetical protein